MSDRLDYCAVCWKLLPTYRPGSFGSLLVGLPPPARQGRRHLRRLGVTTNHARAATMNTAGRFVVVGWLLLALVLLGMDGQLPVFLAWTAPATLLVLAVGALVRQQRAPSMLDRPQLPEPYRVADDLRQPLCAVVAAGS